MIFWAHFLKKKRPGFGNDAQLSGFLRSKQDAQFGGQGYENIVHVSKIGVA